MNIKREEKLRRNINHIFESGVNEIRIIEAVKLFIAQEYESLLKKPEPVNENKPLPGVVEGCINYIEWVDSDQYYEEKESDRMKYIAERALIEVYGPDVFDWINNRRK